MSFNSKTIAVSVVALLAAAGGLYAVMPDQETAAANQTSSTQTVANAKPETSQEVLAQPNVAEVQSKGASVSVTELPSTLERPASQAPKKLTSAQLTPPPLTEEEKLQKAAQQESNF